MTLTNTWGLHAKTAFALAREAMGYTAGITVEKGGTTVDGKRVDELLMLAAGCGDALTICANGPDEQAALHGLTALIESNFGEEQ